MKNLCFSFDKLLKPKVRNLKTLGMTSFIELLKFQLQIIFNLFFFFNLESRFLKKWGKKDHSGKFFLTRVF